MDSEQILERMARLFERAPKRKAAKIEAPVELQELLWVYFRDPYRPRLSGNAFLVWAFLLEKADLESRIATVSFREIKMKTGLRSNRTLHLALAELDRFGYLVSSTLPTGPGQPRNYKIPDHVRKNRFAHYEVMRLSKQADRPRKWPRQKAWMLNQATPQAEKPVRPAAAPPWEQIGKTTPAPRPPDPANADIIQALEKLDQEIAQAMQARAEKENVAQKK